MSELTIHNHRGQLVADSRDVAAELPYKDIYLRCKERLGAVHSFLTGSG